MTTHPATPPAARGTTGPHHARTLVRGAVGVVATVALLGISTGSATADSDTGATTANVEVSSAIALTGLTPSFTLTGVPGATVTGDGAVTMNVETNNLAGYAVTVQSRTATMAAGAGNPDSIPIGAMSVRETDTTPYTALTTAAQTVHTQATRSAEGGDEVSNDFEVVIPFVNADTYTATLDYIASTL